MSAQTFTRDEVAKHTTEDSIWCIIDHRVYDLTDFLDAHPGGAVVLTQVAGKDATTEFYNLHRQEVLQKYKKTLCIGTVAGEEPEVIEPEIGGLSPVPYGEPLWLRPEFKSPYYNDSHRRLQRAIRQFTEEYVVPEAQEKEKDGSFISQELIDLMAETNILAMRLGPGKHLHGKKLLGGVVDGKEFDYFHDLIIAQEITRTNARGSFGCLPWDLCFRLTAGLSRFHRWQHGRHGHQLDCRPTMAPERTSQKQNHRGSPLGQEEDLSGRNRGFCR